MSLTITPEEATARLHHSFDPIVEKVGPIYTYTSSRMVYPVIVSNQPGYITEKFRGVASPDVLREGYNNLMSLHNNKAVLQYEW